MHRDRNVTQQLSKRSYKTTVLARYHTWLLKENCCITAVDDFYHVPACLHQYASRAFYCHVENVHHPFFYSSASQCHHQSLFCLCDVFCPRQQIYYDFDFYHRLDGAHHGVSYWLNVLTFCSCLENALLFLFLAPSWFFHQWRRHHLLFYLEDIFFLRLNFDFSCAHQCFCCDEMNVLSDVLRWWTLSCHRILVFCCSSALRQKMMYLMNVSGVDVCASLQLGHLC